jgi:succinoglycan biosynthesis transport protein ExoP
MAFEDGASADPFSSGGGGGQSPLDLRKLVGVLRRFWWIPILTAAAGVGLALLYFKSVKPAFRSAAEIRVERRSATSVGSGNGPVALEGATTTEDLKTLEASFLNPKVIDRVVAALQLKTTDNFIASDRPASTVTEDELMGYLYKYASVALVQDTRLMEVSFENWNPATAQKVADALAEQGIEEDGEQRVQALGGNVRFLKEEAAKLEQSLRNSEEKYNLEMRKLGSVSIDDQTNIEVDQLRDLNSRLTEAKSQRLKLESDYEQIQACLNDPDKLLAIESIGKVAAVERLYLRASELRGQLVKLAQRYGPQNPLMIQTETELREVEKTLKQEILQAPRSVEVALASAQRNEEGLSREQASQEKRVIELKELALNASGLKRQIDAEKISYATTLSRLNEEVSQSRSQPVLLQIVKPAGPAYPVSVTKLKVLAVGLMGGLMVGAGLLLLIMQLDSSVKAVEDAESAFKLSVLAAVPEYPRAGENLAQSPIVNDQYSTVAEAFRSLRTAIRPRDRDAKLGLVLVTSALPAEGKTFCALNLGVALAQTGQRTLLVDAQLRHPALEVRVLGTHNSHGLSDYLQGVAGFSSVIRGTSVHNLDIVTAGTPTSHPAELLSRKKFEDFLAEAQPHYDRIIFDSAPIEPVSDTLGIARYFPVICLVLKSGKTPKAAVERSIEKIGRSGAKLAGIVMNFVSHKQASARAVDLRPDEVGVHDALGFPVTCAKCQKTYQTLEDFLGGTQSIEETPSADTRLYITRACSCGELIRVPSENRRDFSEPGGVRRKIFGELHERLVASGMPRDEARAKLLLTLKIWRNEISGDQRSDNSEAAARRNELFGQLVAGLAASGYSQEEARARLLEAIQIWRGAP